MDAQIYGAVAPCQKRKRTFEVVLQSAVKQCSQGGDGVAGGRRVGRIRLNQDGGLFAAQQVSAEIFRNGYDKLTSPRARVMSASASVCTSRTKLK